MRVYESKTYRDYLKKVVETSPSTGAKVTYSRLALWAGVQKSYLSQVMAGDANLNGDQLFLVCKALSLNEAEADYLLLLLEIDRCQIAERRRRLEARRDQVRRQKLKPEEYLGDRVVRTSGTMHEEYYRDALCSFAHMLLMVGDYAADKKRLAQRLGASEAHVEEVLATLERCGIVTPTLGSYRVNSVSMHLDKDSPVAKVHGTLMRLKGVDHLQRARGDEDFFLSTTFSTTDDVRAQVKARFLQFLKSVADDVAAVQPSDVFHINFDLFKI